MNWSPRMLSVLRIMTGALFLEHGTQKLFGFPPAVNGGPALLSLLGIQGAIELAGGLLILLGLITRPVAFVLAGDMAVAYFMSHAPRAFFPVLNAGDAAILYCFIFFSIWPSPEQDRGASRADLFPATGMVAKYTAPGLTKWLLARIIAPEATRAVASKGDLPATSVVGR